MEPYIPMSKDRGLTALLVNPEQERPPGGKPVWVFRPRVQQSVEPVADIKREEQQHEDGRPVQRGRKPVEGGAVSKRGGHIQNDRTRDKGQTRAGERGQRLRPRQEAVEPSRLPEQPDHAVEAQRDDVQDEEQEHALGREVFQHVEGQCLQKHRAVRRRRRPDAWRGIVVVHNKAFRVNGEGDPLRSRGGGIVQLDWVGIDNLA